MKENNQRNSKHYIHHLQYGTSFAWAFVATVLVASSVAQASDMQIYAVPTAGKKTIVMMLDTSGSMGVNSSSNAINADYGVCSNRSDVSTETGGSSPYTYTRTYCSVSYSTSTSSNYQKLKDICYNPNKNADGSYSTRTDALKCYDRMSRLQDGMFAFLNSDNPKLNEARVGLGHFSVNGSGRAGKILVTSEKLGETGSAQRNLLKEKIASLTASGGTPTSHAYAEAAAYLMGTSTRSASEIQKDLYKKETTQVIDYYQCNDSRYPHLNPANNICYQYQGFSGSAATPASIYNYSCTNSSYPNLNPVDNKCYQYEGYSGSTSSSSDAYRCPPANYPAYTAIGTSNSTTKKRCYKPSGVNGTDYQSAAYKVCTNNSYPYLNPADNKCYQRNTGYGGDNRNATQGSFIRYECQNSGWPYLNSADNRCYQLNTGYGGNGQGGTAVYKPVTTYYKCLQWMTTDFPNGVQYCGTGSSNQRTSTDTRYWENVGSAEPSDFAGDGTETISNRVHSYTLDMQLGTNADSGFDASIASSKDGINYISPLPATENRVSCDGQGIYVLSDGEANNSSVARSSSVISAALGTYGSGFTCPTSGGLNTGADASWHCMGEFAKKLFNGGQIQTVASKITNPVNVPIQTAFVGFGKDFNSLTQTHVQQACKLSSRTQTDRKGDDACSPNQAAANKVNFPGYGNGGFFTTQTAQGVTDSVIAFLDNLGDTPLEPLTTGSISVPADALSPSGLQPYGYLRALEPNPQSSLAIWAGNLKRYKVVLSGNNAGAFADANSTVNATSKDASGLIYDKDGAFKKDTKDLWNSNDVYGKSYNDGGLIGLGGALSRVPMPVAGQTENLNSKPIQYAYAEKPNALRSLFTDVDKDGGAELTGAANGASLLRIPDGPIPKTDVPAYILKKFGEQTTLKDFPLTTKQKLLNYLGFSVAMGESETELPDTLSVPSAPHLAMGGSVHSFPVQLTYSGNLDAAGKLNTVRSQSIMYGTMDGGLHIVDSTSGEEQMVFIPSELLKHETKSKGLVKGASSSTGTLHGVDGAWVADALYKSKKAASKTDSNRIEARQMNVYGGLRMGGESYYGLDVLDISNPKLLFRIGSDQSDFSRMGQTWSKPVIANIRYNDKIRRVMIVGGGYDVRYEDPTFALASGTVAQGNAVYIIDATTGDRLWWASNASADTNNANMRHSIVSRISAIDRNGDGLIDHLYFGDLGGQVFRADLNNATGTAKTDFGKRVVRLANLATTAAGVDLTGGKNPRFYEAPTVTIHDQGATTFMLIGIASGNRSTPLDVYPLRGRDGMSPANALNDRLVNNVYGVIDRDFIKTNLITDTPALTTENLNLSNLQKDPQKLTDNIFDVFVGKSATKQGWYRSLSSNSAGVERADNSFRISGGMKAMEEPIALTGNLIVPVYDPQGTGIAQQDPCKPRIIGETDSQRFCLPYGVCVTSKGEIDSAKENGTGFKTKIEDCPPNVTECNDKVLGGGIVGLAPVPITDPDTTNACPDFSIAGNTKGNGRWKCIPTINPTRWYERWKK